MQKQGAKLYAALVLLVESLRQPDELQRILRPLGKKHIGYGATAEHYPMVGNALMHALEKFLPDRWTPELGAAWANPNYARTFAEKLNLLRFNAMRRDPFRSAPFTSV